MAQLIEGQDEILALPENSCGTGVLVLGGSSGRIDHGRAELLADHGAIALAPRWFGGAGQQPGPWEVPLEIFVAALDRLETMCDRLAVVGVSFGAEAALLTSSLADRLSATICFAPSSVVWAGIPASAETGRPSQTSHWTWRGRPVPFVPFDEEWQSHEDPPAFASLYRQSLSTHADHVPAATIAAERIGGDVVLVAGGDDQVWDSVAFAHAIAARRTENDGDTIVVTHPLAGHRTVLPGEVAVTAGQSMARGGTPEADRELGRLAWPALVAALQLTDVQVSSDPLSP